MTMQNVNFFIGNIHLVSMYERIILLFIYFWRNTNINKSINKKVIDIKDINWYLVLKII